MKLKDLNHSLTPLALQDLNEKIAALLADESSDYALLKSAIDERDSFVQKYLENISPAEKRRFAKNELEVNNRLSKVAQSLLSSSEKEIIQLVRGKAAIQKYK